MYLFSFRKKKANVDLTMKQFQGILRNKREIEKPEGTSSDFQRLSSWLHFKSVEGSFEPVAQIFALEGAGMALPFNRSLAPRKDCR